MLTVTQNMMLPTAITGSYPRPLWFDASLEGRSFKAALGQSLFREQYLDAVAAIINAQEAAGLDIVTDGDSRFDLAVGGKSWFFYRSNVWVASGATATPHAAGWSATTCAPEKSSGRCRRPISPASSRRS